MTVIKITGIPKKMNMKALVHQLMKCIPDEFEYRGFDPERNKIQKTKSFHITLSPKSDPASVMKIIREKIFSGGARLHAMVVDVVPFSNVQPKQTVRKCYKPSEAMPAVLTHIYNEILVKYQRLIKLNVRYKYILFDKLALILFERLKEIVKNGGRERLANTLELSKAYRARHPHTGDLDTVRDAIAATRLEIEDPLASDDEEEHLTETPPHDEKTELTHAQVQSICDKYTAQISTKMMNYIGQLDTEVRPGDNSEEVARKRVRREMKDMSTLLGAVLKQIVQKNVSHDFTPELYGMQIYGEPTLPPQKHMLTLLQRLKAQRISFSHVLFNKIDFSVPDFKYAAVKALNGKQIGIAKLRVVLRTSNSVPRFKHAIFNTIRDYCDKEYATADN